MIRGDGSGGFEGGRLEPPRQWEGDQGPGPSLWVSLTARGRQARHGEAYEPSSVPPARHCQEGTLSVLWAPRATHRGAHTQPVAGQGVVPPVHGPPFRQLAARVHEVRVRHPTYHRPHAGEAPGEAKAGSAKAGSEQASWGQVPQLATLLRPVPLMRAARRLARGMALGHHAVSVAAAQSARAVFSGHARARRGGLVYQADVDRPKEVRDADQVAHLIKDWVQDRLGLGFGSLNLERSAPAALF